MSEWETFCDRSYYDLWRVRRKNERGFNDGYHIHNGEEARALVDLLNGLESKLKELEQLVAVKRSNNRCLDARNKRLERERDEARLRCFGE